MYFEIEHLVFYSHKIKVLNGKGHLKIRMSKHMSYLEYKSPVALHWLADGPATFMCDYLSSLPLSWKLKDEINTGMNEELEGNPDDLNRLAFERIEPLLDVFENGSYGIYYNPEFQDAKLVFPPLIEKLKDKTTFLSKVNRAYSDDPEFSEDTFLVQPYADYIPLVATQQEIHRERVDFYIDQINQGKRPHAILFCSCFDHYILNKNGSKSDDSVYSNFYVVDGHHKLLAYQETGISPALIFITHIPESLEEVEPMCENVFNHAQPYHFAAMMESIQPTDPLAIQIMNSENELLKNYLWKYSYSFKTEHQKEKYFNKEEINKPASWWQKLFGIK